MPLEVYSAAKPDAPMRAWASAFGLLVGATALAWSMSAAPLDRRLGMTESPRDWGLSFRVPKGFERLDVKRFSGGTVRRYRSAQGASPLIFSAWWFDEVGDLTADHVCDLVLQASSDTPLRALIAGQATPRDELVGGVAAKEIESPPLAMVVRAAVTNECAVAFALNGLDPVVVRRGYAAFDLSCRSVEFARD